MDEQSKSTGMPTEPRPLEEGREQVRRLGEAVRDRALKSGEERRTRIVDQLGRLAERLADIGSPDGGEANDYARRAADLVRNVERTLGDHSTEELLGMAEDRIRERPGLFLAGCFALGFGVARLLRK